MYCKATYDASPLNISLTNLFLQFVVSVRSDQPSLDRRAGGTRAMPYILVTTQIRLEKGPCIVGDEKSDPEIMKYLEAEQQREKGQFFKVWESKLVPRQVLNKLEAIGYSVVTTTGIGQTFVVTLHKPV